jgi:alpha-beta hydrolase superfamily lysophospholipase
MKHQESTLTTLDGVRLFTQQWLPDDQAKAVIVIAHGLAEHSSRYAHVARYLVQSGYAVYTFDQRGHGQSRGDSFGYFERFDLLSEDLRQYIELAQAEQKSGPPFLLGHSLGSLLALYYTIRYQTTLKGLISSGALVNANEVANTTTRLLTRVLSAVAPQMGIAVIDSSTISKDQAVVRAYDLDPNNYRGKIRARVGAELMAATAEVLDNLGRITLPILILHGGSDRLVPPGSSRVVYKRVGSADKTLKIYDGLYHEIFNEPEKDRVLADVLVWLETHRMASEPGTSAQGGQA